MLVTSVIFLSAKFRKIGSPTLNECSNGNMTLLTCSIWRTWFQSKFPELSYFHGLKFPSFNTSINLMASFWDPFRISSCVLYCCLWQRFLFHMTEYNDFVLTKRPPNAACNMCRPHNDVFFIVLKKLCAFYLFYAPLYKYVKVLFRKLLFIIKCF